METRQHQVARMVRELAKEHHSKALAQLASRIGAVAKFGARSGEDPFAKIKGLVSDLISQLQQEAKQEADEKAYCDQQLAETQKKKERLEFHEQKIRVRHDTKVSTAKRLTAKIAELQEVITQLTQEQLDMTKVREEERKINTQLQADLQQGLLGLRNAYRLLRKYYGAKDEGDEGAALVQESQGQPSKPIPHKKQEGAGSDILALLEVCEADVAQSLATVETEESNAQQAYEKRTQEIKVSLAQEMANEKNKRKSVEALAVDVNELRDDLGSRVEEISAVTQFLTELKSKCEGRATPAEERLRRRAAEIDGLKQALEQFDDASAATSFVQIKVHDRRSLRQAAIDAP
jgi:chromosome segregation ATPase